jgi:ABC-type phosphate transport system substrate-binding protein
MKKIGKVLLATIAIMTTAIAQAEVVVIVNTASSASLDKASISNIFLGKDKSFKAVDLSDSTKDDFYQKLSGKNESQMKSYWSGLVFTGKGTPPKSFDSAQAVIDHVKSDPSHIGYIPASAVSSDVKVILNLP